MCQAVCRTPNTWAANCGIDLDQLRRHRRSQDAQILARRRRRRRHVLAPIEGEAGVLDDLGDGMPGMHAREREAPSRPVEREQAAIGDEGARSARTMDVVRARSRRADEIDLFHQGAAGVLETEQDHLRHHIVEIGRAERAGEARLRMRVVADAHKIDIGLAVDLGAGQKERVDPSLAGAIEQFAPAVGEEVLPPAAQQRDIGPPAAALARQHRRGRRDRRGGADGDVARVADQSRDAAGQQLFLAEGCALFKQA